MAFHLGVGGAWKKAEKVHIGVGGAWKTVRKMYIGVGGAWKEFYTNLEVTLAGLTGSNTVVDPNDAFGAVSVYSNGTWETSSPGSPTGTWLTGGTASEVELYLSGSGNTLWAGSSALDTWLPCTANYTWALSQTTIGGKSWSGTIQFREIATGIILDTAPVSISADVES